MEFLSKGGYAEVFYDTERGDIFRRLPRINSSTRQLDITSFNDLIFTKSLEYTNYTPIIYNEKVSKEYVSFNMPNYGITLHEWVKENTIQIRQKYAPYILLQLIIGCIYFDKNAFFHSDLKPSNIMIETIFDNGNKDRTKNWKKYFKKGSNDTRAIKDIIVRIIDFNSTSIRIIDNKDPIVYWANAIGTWNYVPPEIILHDTPYSNSISWTIGVIAAFIIDEYPFIDTITKEMDRTLVDQSKWIKTIEDWYINYPNNPPLLRKEWYDDKWKQVICSCIQWDNSIRWTLEHMYTCIFGFIDDHMKSSPTILIPSNLSKIQPISYTIELADIPCEDRHRIVFLIYSICDKVGNMNLFPTAVAIFDRSIPLVNVNVIKNINWVAAGAFILSSFVNNLDLLCSRTNVSLILNTFACINKSHVLVYMYHIGDILEWKIWEKPVHIIVIERDERLKTHPKLFEYIRDAFLRPSRNYTQNEIANCVMKSIEPVNYLD